MDKYKEALERARIAYKDENRHLKAALERIFPELKESKDERIRKALIKSFEIHDLRALIIPGFSAKDIIAWLEKQGESTDINPSEFDLRLNKLLKQFETLSKEELASSLSFYLNVVQNDGTYREEKQGEQKPIDKIQLGKRYKCIASPRYSTFMVGEIYEPKDKFLCSLMNFCSDCFESIEDNEQKPADKVEPKFHEGEWVVDNAGYIWKIKGILNKFYILEGVEGDESRPTTEWADDTFHLWTIKDAKDGDVLCCESGWTCIFKKLNHNSFGGLLFDSYCFIDRTGWFCDGAEGHTLDERINGKIYPATKEQRDTLMKAMADAGYTFDFEKLELKKIVVPIFNIGDTIVEKDLDECSYGTIKDIKNGQYIFTDGSSINIDEQEEWQLKTSTNIEQKPADWSEEDEDIRDTIIRDLKRLGGDIVNVKPAYKEEVDWLKSLKRRIGWKPSEEQMKALHDLNLTGNISYAGQGQVLIELYNDLEELIK